MCEFCKERAVEGADGYIESGTRYQSGGIIYIDDDAPKLCFNNSCNEYKTCFVYIKYCPMCGEKLEEEVLE